MPDVKISELPVVVTPATSDELEVIQGGVNKRESLSQVQTLVLGNIPSDVSTLQGQVSGLDGEMNTAQGDISTLQGQVSGLDGEVNTAQGDISTLQGQVSTINGKLIKTIAVNIVNPTMGYINSIEVQFAGTIVGWSILSDVVSSCVIDVRKTNYATIDPPSVLGSSIAGSEKPTLVSAEKNQDNTLTTWTTGLSAGDWLSFYMESCSEQATKVTLFIKVTL